MDPWNFLGVTGVDGYNAGMGVGTPQDLAMEQAWEPHVSPIASPARNFLSAVLANGPRPNNVVFLAG